MQLRYSAQFRRDIKRFVHEKVTISELETVLDILATEKKLPDKYHNHPLVGKFKGCFDCHIRPDVVLVYKIDDVEVSILLLRLGSHSEVF